LEKSGSSNGIRRKPFTEGFGIIENSFYLLIQINIMHLDQTDVIMCEENSGKNFGKTIV
jgi:hypothetical protein